MKNNNIAKILFENIWAKSFCVLISAILWLYVSSSQSIVAKLPGAIKVKTINVPTNLVPIYDTKEIEVKIGANRDIWQKVSPDSFTAYVDLSGLDQGTHEVLVNVSTNIQGVQIIDKKPDKILVRLEPLITMDIDVSAVVEGAAAQGMVAGDISLTPNKIKVTGAKSVLNEIKNAQVLVKLNGENSNFEKTLAPSFYNDKNESINGLESSTKEIVAKVPIIRGSNTKTVPVKPLITGTPKEGYILANIVIDPNIIDITANTNSLNDIKLIETENVDITGLSVPLEKDVLLNIPQGISVLNGILKVKLKITLQQISATRDFNVTNFKVINSSAYPASFSPVMVKLSLVGQPDIINKLGSNDITISFDLKGKNVQDGFIDAMINQDNIILPDGVSLQNFIPTSIKMKF